MWSGLSIEILLWNVKFQRLQDNRLCPKCDKQKVEDEFHFLMECPYYQVDRNKMLATVKYTSLNLQRLCEMDQFVWLMSSQDENIILSLAEFLYKAMEKRYPPT